MAGGPVRWVMTGKGEPFVPKRFDPPSPGPDEALVEIAGCGVCRTDLRVYFDGAAVRHDLPLALGHEISGRVVEAGENALWWIDRAIVVPALIPCGHCEACHDGREAQCVNPKMPGNDMHGGFASHIVVPAHGLCEVDETRLAAAGIALADLAVIADAATASFQAVVDSGVAPGDLVVVIGVGGVGGYAAQIAGTFGGVVVGVDINAERLAAMGGRCALTLDARDMSPADLKAAVDAFAEAKGLPRRGWIILDCSGARAGREAAYTLLNEGAVIAAIGCSTEADALCDPRIAARRARAIETVGLAPELYPQALELVLNGRVKVAEFIEKHPLGEINAVFAAARANALRRRAVLVPERDGAPS